ncbi:DUF1259 domain-containing protein [Niallia sp. XMNu-256]|uniref:DUF1259 domain-containing protein n=1 Tax=Niallia sp. XMNu-256 TaxID=3082444 RepID=UPI0030D04375
MSRFISGFEELCEKLARILKGTPFHEDGECTIMIERDLDVEILGKPYKTEHEITVQSLEHGESLNTGELVVLQKEVNPLLVALKKQGFLVTAIHNHWLFDKPKLMYIHIESVDEPVEFAKKLRDALSVLD